MMRIQVSRNHVSIYLLRPPHYFGLHHPLPISNAQESSRLPLLENNLAQPMIRIATVVLATSVESGTWEDVGRSVRLAIQSQNKLAPRQLYCFRPYGVATSENIFTSATPTSFVPDYQYQYQSQYQSQSQSPAEVNEQ